ncbi:MAG: DNA alkylation repair protein [Pseudomonadota bacterium]
MSESFEQAVRSAAASLRAQADPVAAPIRKAYLKSPFEVLGCTVPTVRKAAKAVHRVHKKTERSTLLEPLERLWASPVHDDRILAMALAQLYVDRFKAGDVETLFGRWLGDCQTWDHTDGISASVVGVIALHQPDAWRTIAAWSDDAWMWRRRASLLAHIPAIRQGNLRFAQFRESCDKLIDEREFFIRKAIGWVLREMATRDPDLNERLLLEFGPRASRLTIREATRRLPAERRARLLAILERSPAH